MKFFKWILFLGLAISICGCATYKSQMVLVKDVNEYSNKFTISNVVIAVDPFDEEEKSKAVFYVDLATKDIKSLQIIISNNSEDNISIIRSQIRLIDGSGNEYKPVESKYVYDLFENDQLAYGFWGCGMLSYMSAEQANKKMKSDWYEKEFPEEKTVLVNRGGDGFLFFKTNKHLKGCSLKIRVLNLRSSKFTDFVVPIN